MFCVQNLKASEIFWDLIVLLRYLSKPITSLDENILTYFLFPNSDFARSSITGDLGRSSLKRGTEKVYFLIAAAKSRLKVPKLGGK